MAKDTSASKILGVRVPRDGTLRTFEEKLDLEGVTQSEFLRECIEAYADGRLKIRQKFNQRKRSYYEH